MVRRKNRKGSYRVALENGYNDLAAEIEVGDGGNNCQQEPLSLRVSEGGIFVNIRKPGP
jgi:hypothetical protein